MEHFHHSKGRIIYDPYRGEMKNRTQWWCVLDVDREITRYNRWWLQKEKHIFLHEPSWNAHCSVIRGETACASQPELWKKYHNKTVDFTYEHGILRCAPDKKHGGFYYWVKVECPFLAEMRQELNLPVGWNFHITIGRTHY